MNNTSLKNRLIELGCLIDNDYLDLYVSLIIENQNNIKIAHKTNAHHIIPRAYFKLKNLPVDDSENNLCELLYIDHIRAHYYLLKCTCGEFKSRCYLAFQFIYGKYFSQDIEKLTEFDWEYIQKCHEEQRLLDSLSKKGVPKSESVKQKIGEANRGKKRSIETRTKISNSLKGKEPWNKGGKGTVTKGCLGQHWYTNGVNNILAFECPEGFQMGRVNVHKGYKHPEEVRRKMSAAKKDKCFGGNNNKAHKVSMFSKDNKYIRTFDTIKEAEEFVGAVGVGAVIKGKQKTCGGYIWKDGKN